MSELMSIRIMGRSVVTYFLPLAPGPHPRRELTPMRRRRLCLAVGAAWPQALSVRRRRFLVVSRLRRLRRPRPVDAQADAVPERLQLALDFVVAEHEIFEDGLIPL